MGGFAKRLVYRLLRRGASMIGSSPASKSLSEAIFSDFTLLPSVSLIVIVLSNTPDRASLGHKLHEVGSPNDRRHRVAAGKASVGFRPDQRLPCTLQFGRGGRVHVDFAVALARGFGDLRASTPAQNCSWLTPLPSAIC